MKIKSAIKSSNLNQSSNKDISNGYASLNTFINQVNLPFSLRRSALTKLKRSIKSLHQSPQKNALLEKIRACEFDLLKNSFYYSGKIDAIRKIETDLLNTKNEKRILYTHFILDSYADSLPAEEYAKRSHPILLLMRIIEELLTEVKRDEAREKLYEILQSLEIAFKISAIKDDYYYDKTIKYNKEFLNDLFEKELDLLEKDPKSYLRPIFVPANTFDHAIILKITYEKDGYFILNVVNTSQERENEEEASIQDICFTHIPKENLKMIPGFLLKQFIEFDSLLYELRGIFSSTVQESKGAIHKGQKGDSCSIKCVTSALKQSLPNSIYREIKYALTARLIEENQDHPYSELGLKILNKRNGKRVPL